VPASGLARSAASAGHSFRVVREVADCIEFGNGMAVTPDNSTSIVAESFGCRLTAFDIAADGSLARHWQHHLKQLTHLWDRY